MSTLMTSRQQESKILKLKVGGQKKHSFEPYQRSSRTCTGTKKKLQLSEPPVDKSVFLRHSSMSSSGGSEPEWDTAGDQDVFGSDGPFPATYIDILTTDCPVHFDSEWGTVEQDDLFEFVAVPFPAVYVDILTTSAPQQHATPSPKTPLTNVTTGSSRHSFDGLLVSESCIAERDMLDGGRYLVQSFMLEGSYGTVAKAVDTRTRDKVAIKIIKKRCNYDEVAEHEMTMLRKLQVLDSDACGIVRYFDSFVHNGFKCMVFESLDVDLLEFVEGRSNNPISMAEMRPIVRQLAIALQALKGIGLIHTDIKLENVMLVNQREQPLKVKLIDFGLAVPASETKQWRIVPNLEYRAPEVFLGLPLTEALDMWSLGCVVANCMLSRDLFSGKTEYDLVQSILLTLGMPEQSLLDAGQMTCSFFIQDDDTWRFMKPEEYSAVEEFEAEGEEDLFLDDSCSLEEVFAASLCDDADEAGDVLWVFVDLLKGMLHLDPEWRITPGQVLDHPFITGTKPSPTKPPRRSKST